MEDFAAKPLFHSARGSAMGEIDFPTLALKLYEAGLSTALRITSEGAASIHIGMVRRG
jgi:hypothetical protein